jgi:tRNA nucleotidyltransferase/poly(A) polymerase
VRGVLSVLAAAGHEAVLVGGCLRDLCLGRRVADWDVASSADPEQVLALFPRAVPIGLRFGTVMVPSAAGPIDVTRYRGPDLAADLARRDFTVNAMALALAPSRWVDPEGGLADLRAGRLRAVGSAAARLAEDPLRALRALRLVATLDLALDPALAAALPAVSLRSVARERIRAELERLLIGPAVGRALVQLREVGFEVALFGSPLAPDAPAVVAALAPDLELRLAGWLRGRDAGALLGGLRFPRQRAEDVGQLVRLHPIDSERMDLGRLLQRLGGSGVLRLLALREAELAAGSLPREAGERASRRVAELRETVSRLERAGVLSGGRPQLAVGGEEVMAWLGCGPGPRVGRALAHLTLRVLADPSKNEPAALRELLRAWQAAGERS